MKIFQITLAKGNERKYVYCKLEKTEDLSLNTDFYNSYTDCQNNQNKINENDEVVSYTYLMIAIKKHLEQK